MGAAVETGKELLAKGVEALVDGVRYDLLIPRIEANDEGGTPRGMGTSLLINMPLGAYLGDMAYGTTDAAVVGGAAGFVYTVPVAFFASGLLRGVYEVVKEKYLFHRERQRKIKELHDSL